MQHKQPTFNSKIEFKSCLTAVYPMKKIGQFLTFQVEDILSRNQIMIVSIWDIHQSKEMCIHQERIQTKNIFFQGLKNQILMKYKSEICDGYISKEDCFINDLWTQANNDYQKHLIETSVTALISEDEAIVAKPRNLLSIRRELIRKDVLIYYKGLTPTETNLILTGKDCINKIEVICPFNLLIQTHAGQLQILRRSKTNSAKLSVKKCLITIKEDNHKLDDFTVLQEAEILMLYNALDENSMKFHVYDIKKCQSIRCNSYVQNHLGEIKDVIPLQEKFLYLIEFVYKMTNNTVCLLNALTMEIIPLISQSEYHLVGVSADKQLILKNKDSFVLYEHPKLQKALSLKKEVQQQIHGFFNSGISNLIAEYAGNDIKLDEKMKVLKRLV